MPANTIRALCNRLIDRILGAAGRAADLAIDDETRLVLNPELPSAAVRAKFAAATRAACRPALYLVHSIATPATAAKVASGAGRPDPAPKQAVR